MFSHDNGHGFPGKRYGFLMIKSTQMDENKSEMVIFSLFDQKIIRLIIPQLSMVRFVLFYALETLYYTSYSQSLFEILIFLVIDIGIGESTIVEEGTLWKQ